ncbi:MAG: CopG family transcriptional regulator [Gammaproteobacteria bacterium]|nr:CopG family transcriptional regulator [Gammaproteobacteria bacterium]MDE0479420.1 CopG family transcriptional regulator [Gammaproteobacteria bacterium]MDE0508890.1 CopG family transcriptional regulator [Gammaproteobacteria bacterium]
MRINARLDEECAAKLRQLQSVTRKGVSDLVKQAIVLLHRHELNRPTQRLDDLLASDFIGCAAGPEDLASNYKHYLTEGLERKHGAR